MTVTCLFNFDMYSSHSGLGSELLSMKLMPITCEATSHHQRLLITLGIDLSTEFWLQQAYAHSRVCFCFKTQSSRTHQDETFPWLQRVYVSCQMLRLVLEPAALKKPHRGYAAAMSCSRHSQLKPLTGADKGLVMLMVVCVRWVINAALLGWDACCSTACAHQAEYTESMIAGGSSLLQPGMCAAGLKKPGSASKVGSGRMPLICFVYLPHHAV